MRTHTATPCHVRHLVVIAVLLVAGCASQRPAENLDRDYWSRVNWSAVLDDPVRTCPVHQQPLQESSVTAYGGMALTPPHTYVKALLRRFPYSRWYLEQGTCIAGVIPDLPVFICPACRRVETLWRANRGWPTDPATRPHWGPAQQ